MSARHPAPTSPSRSTSTSTLAVHTGRDDLRRLGVHAPPIDLSTTYPLADLDQAGLDLEALASGEEPQGSPIYARLFNPTVDRFERGLATLEGTAQAVAFGSGMAALTACLLAASQRGRHVVAVRPLYGTSDHLLSSCLLGLEVSWTKADEVAQALRPDTSLVVIETPGNPTLQLVDIADVVRQAGDVPVLVDSTFATPVLQKPAAHGAALVLHSATKFLGGHGDVVAGVVACNEDWAGELRKVRVMTGALLHPLAAYLLHRGLPTLPLRVGRAQETAGELAWRLERHGAVVEVFYPGQPARDPRRLVGRQMSGPGSMVSFEVRGGHNAARRVMARLATITPAVSLGSVDTLIQHPAGLTHRMLDQAVKAETGISEGLLRLSVGLEDVEDLWRDLDQSLNAALADIGRDSRMAA